MVSSKRRSYTTEQREAVLADVRASGVIAASKKHQVPQSCVSRWATAAGVTRAVGEKSSAVTKASRSGTPSPSEPVPADDNVSAAPASSPAAKR
jgi:transposase-like protein